MSETMQGGDLRHDSILIYLADLTHDGTGKLAVDMMPYNIGLIAAYAKQCLGDQVEIKLFKYVRPLLEALRARPPHILGCSNYAWNSYLSEFACSRAKRVSPQILTVQGGTNYPFNPEVQRQFLQSRPSTDINVFYEGEAAFVHLVQAYLACRDPRELRERPIDGCHALSQTTGALVAGSPVPRIRELNLIPSPYATGLLDEFFDGMLTPLAETNRGCPFTCNFCNAGNAYFNKVNMFSLEHLEEEFSYIAPRIAAAGIRGLMLADNNFGMYPRDEELCRLFRRLQDTYGWPMRILSFTGKNHKERIIKVTEILGTSMSINMSVQSMNQSVLQNIKRQNVSLDTYRQVNEVLLQQGRMQKAEVIVPLPGETYETYRVGLKALMDARAQQIYSYTLQLLYGTDYEDPSYLRRWGYAPKWRLVTLNFGEYDGEKVFDIEPVAVESNTLTFDDYLKIRTLVLLTELMYNDYQYWELIKYLTESGCTPFAWIEKALAELPGAPEAIQGVVQGFIRDTKEELWNSEEALFAHYRIPANYERLLRGEAGHNVVFTHKGLVISRHMEEWLRFITRACLALILEKAGPWIDATVVREELGELERFIAAKLEGVLQHGGNTAETLGEMSYDILEWSRDLSGRRLRDYRLRRPATYRFFFTEEQLREREEGFRLYGHDRIGLSRIFARNPSLNSLYRRVESLGCLAVA